MKLINNICRTYLWAGGVAASNRALVSQEKVCQPAGVGGINVIHFCDWNKVTILKHLWVITKKKVCLWVKWVHTYYLRTNFVNTCVIPWNTTSVIRKIIEARKYILYISALQGSLIDRMYTMVLANRFSIKKLYTTLKPKFP